MNGAQLALGAANTFGDTSAITLPAAVTAFPAPGAATNQPGNGSSLLLNVANSAEITGPVTGNGAIIANQSGAFLGMNVTADVTSNIVFKNTNGQQPNLYKLGPNKLTLTGVSDSIGVHFIAGGEVALSGTGRTAFGETRPLRGGLLTLDNSGTPLDNRLGANTKSLAPGGGTINLIGHATTPVIENVANLFNSAASSGPFVGNPGLTFLNITPGAAATTLLATNIERFNDQGIGGQRSATWVFRAPSLSNQPGTYNNAGVYTPNAGNTAIGLIQVTNPGFSQQGGFNVGPGGNITAAAGTPVLATRGDVLGDASATGPGTGFVTEDTVAGGFRRLAASEYASFVRDNVTNPQNVRISGTVNTTGDTRLQTLTLTPGSTLNINGPLPLNATPSRLIVNAAGVFVESGGTATIGGGANTFLQTNSGTSLFLHTQGNLNLNAKAFSDNAIVKTGAGTLEVGAGAFDAFRGSLQIDGGTVNLAAGNGFANIRGQNGFTTNANLFLNAGTLNLNGNSQFLNQLNNNNALPGIDGTLTSATAATVTVNGGGAFSGQITGAISLDKTTNNTLLLTNGNPFTGTTLVRSGTLALRDFGTLSGTSAVEVQNATLQLDNSYLSNVGNRLPAGTPVTLKGATLNLTGAAGQTASQRFDTLTLAAGLNQFTSNAGGSGVNVIDVGNLVRPAGGGAFVNFNQNFGFLGAPGNTSTAIRNLIGNVNGSALALNDNIVAGWAVVAGSNFATFLPGQGIGAMGNTQDGFANYDSGDLSTATATQNVNDGTARILTTSRVINSLRMAPGANLVNTFNTGVGVTIDTGGLLIDAAFTISLNPAADARNNFITSNSGELDVWVNQNTTGINLPITGNIDLVKSGPQTLNLNPGATLNGTAATGMNVVTMANTAGLEVGDAVSGAGIPAGTVITAISPNTNVTLSNNTSAAITTFVATFGNTYSGRTIVNGGTLTLNQPAASAASRAIPGDLVINNATVTEANVTGQISPTANITVTGGGRFNAVNAAGVTTTLGSITVLDLSGASGTANILDRTASQPTSIVNLSAATAITATNTNPATAPFIGGFTGIVGFTNPTGTTLNIASPTTVNGLAAVGLRIGTQIGTVPLGIAEGGLIKAGTGLLTLDSGATNFTGITTGYNGTVGSLIDALNISQGFVRFDNNGSLGTNTANTTVQSGAVLLGSFNANTVLTGSIKLKNGATIAPTINSFTLGAATTTVANQSVLNIPSGTATVGLYDYFVPSTNGGNITVNGRLAGAGNINLVSAQITGATGTFQLGNPILTGTGANDFTGTINVNANTILASQVAVVAPATRTTGHALGAAGVNLNGGRLRLRDDLSATADLSNATTTYATNVTLNADSFIDANRQTSTTAVNNTINLASLNVLGAHALTVDSGNGYAVGFNNLTGPGTLTKGGTATLNLNGYAGFTGSIAVAGPQGLALGPALGLNLNAATNALPGNFTVGGIHNFAGGKTVTVGNALEVSNNAGSVTNGTNGTNVGAVTGFLTVPNTATVSAAVLRNNGQIGSTGGNSSLTAPSIRGQGLYQTLGQPLTLAGNLANDGVALTTLKVAGDNTVTLTATSSSSTGGTEVQSGTLRVAPGAPATDPLGSGPIRVLGSIATALGANSQPQAAINPTLQFDADGLFSFAENIDDAVLISIDGINRLVNGVSNQVTSTAFTAGQTIGRV